MKLALMSLLALAPHAPEASPAAVVIATSRGVATVPVALDRGHPALAAARLGDLLPVSVLVEDDWAIVSFATQPFRFLLDAPVFEFRNHVTPLVGGAYLARDSLFVPLQWLAEYVPRLFSEGYRYDPLAARFEEVGTIPVISRVSAPGRRPVPEAPPAARRFGLREAHRVVIDAGHGGGKPGNLGLHFPRGVNEKHVTLAVALALREVLEARGVTVGMTRTEDVDVDLMDRAPMCRDDCDLFVSIHVNSLDRRPGFDRVRGVETYFFDEARTADAARVAAMENDHLRYQTDVETGLDGALDFILKDLQRNEYLRESAELADLVQTRLARVHPGGGKRVAQANFAVLRVARRPAILVETGYATNRSDAQFLVSKDGQRRLAEAMADGIIEYLQLYESKTSSNSSR